MKEFIKDRVRTMLLISENELKSKSEKGNRYFKMLQTGKFQHYDSPEGELSTFTKGEEDRKRLVSKLSKEDKKKYNEWLKTEDGQKSLELFKEYSGELNETETHEYIEKLNTDLRFNKPDYKKSVKNSLVDIIVLENGISEKSFDEYDSVIDKVNLLCDDNKNIDILIALGERKNMRPEYVAEKIYFKYLK